jgi:hypothetical protein
MKRLCTLLLTLVMSLPVCADHPIEIIDLNSRSANEMIPLLKPFLSHGSSITGRGYQLIIKTDPMNLSEIRDILKRMDLPPRRLVIHVRQGSLDEGVTNRSQADLQAMVGKQGKVIVGEPIGAGDESRIRYQIQRSTTRSHRDITQTIQVLEGHPAFIASGKAFPIKEHSTVIAGRVVHRQRTTRYREATTGFYVIPYLQGSQVNLYISPHRQQPGPLPGTFDVQYADTVVSGSLGEWILVGSTATTGNDRNSDILSRHKATSADESAIYLLVQEPTR